MLFIKTILLVFPLSILAQIVLSPVPCTLVCIQRSLSVTICEQAQSGISDPSVVPCLCRDTEFIKRTVDCIVNSGECRTAKDKQDSYKYAAGLCDSNGVKLPGETPNDLPLVLSVTATLSSSFISGIPATAIDQSTALPEISIIDETIISMIAVPTFVACEPIQAVNTTYIVVNNVTQTFAAKPTGNCGNYTTTVPFTTTKRSTVTTIPKTLDMVSYVIDAPLNTSMDASGAQGITVQSGFMLALLGLLMCFV